MSSTDELFLDNSRHVAETCLCVRVQRAARNLARHFDEALRPLDLTHGQFSLLNALNQREPPTIGEISDFLAMDRTTVTAYLKPLARRCLVKITVDKADKRSRRLIPTAAGRALVRAAYPLWKNAHAQLDRTLGLTRADRLRGDLRAVSGFVPAKADAA